MKFQNMNVLITGSGRGIGRSIAQAFAEQGAKVCVNFRTDKDSAEATLHTLKGNGHIMHQCDITNADQAKGMIDECIRVFGQLDILVNNAAIHEHHRIDRVDYVTWQSEWKKTLDTNLVAAANLTYCAAQHMIERRSGRIIFVSSRGAFRGEPEQPAYGASKGALNSFGQSMARALGDWQ